MAVPQPDGVDRQWLWWVPGLRQQVLVNEGLPGASSPRESWRGSQGLHMQAGEKEVRKLGDS